MLVNKGSYIYSLEGKDIYGKKNINIKNNKKRKATFDYSLEAIKLNDIYKEVYGKESMFTVDSDEKQYTNSIINITFKYNVREYNYNQFNNHKIYIKLGKEIKDISKIEFKNNLYIKDNEIIAIKVNDKFNKDENEKLKELPKGFKYVRNKDKMDIHVKELNIKCVASADDVRLDLYKNGFKAKIEKEEIKFIRFKRSSGSSRVGKCLFIDEKLYQEIMEWSYMGLDIKCGTRCDLAGMESYISLTTSSIIDTINIDPKSILIIDDFEHTFKDKVMVTEIKNKNGVDKLHTEPKEINITNNIWDGESLLDSSVFGMTDNENLQWVNGKYSDKGMLLLRNRFFKSCCFNTNIQKFFKDNNIRNIEQLNGFTLAKNINEIKLITTPSSIKYLKYNGGDRKDYLTRIDSLFGIVKHEKPTHYLNGALVQSHYQLLNTLQLSKKDVKELLRPSIEYIELLKNDSRVLRYHLKMKDDNKVKCSDINSTNDFMLALLSLNEDFYNTDLCTNFKRDLIDSYINNIKKGHILLKGNYSVLFGSGLEMLKMSCGLFSKWSIESILNKDEVYCKKFKPEEKLIGSRSPHITMSNIWLPQNTTEYKAEQLDRYFNTSNEIIHISAIGNNVLELLSGADFDSDQILLSNNKILIEAAEKQNGKFLVSTNNVDAKKVARKNTPEDKCDLDIKTSKNYIGEIVNCSAYLNAQLWDRVNKGEEIHSKNIQELYKAISQLNVMSCIEIDKAKKEFSIDNKKELDEIRDKWCDKTKPLFFKQFAKEHLKKELNSYRDNINNLIRHEKEPEVLEELRQNKNEYIKSKKNKVACKFSKYECSLDYLIKELSNIKRMKNRDNTPLIYELLSQDINIRGSYDNQVNAIINKCNDLRGICNDIWSNISKSSSDKFEECNKRRDEFTKYLSSLSIKKQTIKKIFHLLNKEEKNKKIFNKIKQIHKKLEKDIKKDDEKATKRNKELLKELDTLKEQYKEIEYELLPIQRLLLSSLFQAKKKIFLEVFKENKKDMKFIEMTNEELCDLTIYGINFIEKS